MIVDLLTTTVGLLLLGLIGAVYIFIIYRLRRLVAYWEGRDVMSQLRPSRRKVAATDKKLDDLHIDLHYKVIS